VLKEVPESIGKMIAHNVAAVAELTQIAVTEPPISTAELRGRAAKLIDETLGRGDSGGIWAISRVVVQRRQTLLPSE